MKVLKPEWVSHDGKPIFSIDIHPDDSRVATGGQGNDSGKVVIWNMAPIRDPKEEADENVPRILCQMDSHLGCVNCVRWSENGKFLASGGDDKLIMIWQISRGFGSGKSFGSNVTIVEHWRAVATLRGHSGDVLDLAWSPQDVWLASCSVDNTIVIWNAHKFSEQIAILKGHSGLVKGVTWDPVGKYLASQSDDKTLRVWRTGDWKEETSVTSCFKECGGTTHVLRLNWSPDGNHIVSAHAMNNAGPTAQIVERTGWGTSLDFVGHRKAITVVRFNPKILSKHIKKSSDKQQQQYSCCAIGSKDRSLSIWLTALKRPLVVMHDMFEGSVLDVSWSRTGLELVCCSIDGSVAYLGFDEQEIGVPMPKDDQQAFLEKVYGKSILANKTPNAPSQIIESAAVLNLQQQQQQQQQHQQQHSEASLGAMSTPSKSSSSIFVNGDMPFKPRDKQIETRTSDGTRRITPIFLAPQPDVGEVGIPTPFTSKSIAFKTTKESSKIIIEKQDRVTMPGMNTTSNSSQSQSMQSTPQPSTPKGEGGEGKKRSVEGVGTMSFAPLHTPMEIDRPATTATTATPSAEKDKPSSPTTQADKDKTTAPLTDKDTKTTIADKTKEVEKERKGDRDQEKDREKPRTPGLLSLKKHKVGRGRPRKADKEAREALMTAALTHTLPTINVEREAPQPVVSSQNLQLPVPIISKTTSRLVEGQTGGDNNLTVEVENDLAAGTGQLHRCRCLRTGTVLWEQILSSRVLAVAGSRHVTCVACEDKTVNLYGAGGKRLLPPLMLGSAVSVLRCTGHYVMAVTSHGYLYIWNTTQLKAVVQAQSLSSVMSGGERIIHATLTSEGVPVLTVSSGKSYSFAPEIGSWMVVSNREDRLQMCSDHQHCVPSKPRSTGPLASVQGGGRAMQQAGRVFQSSSHMQHVSTLSHLETQMATCLALKSSSEYRFWLETYIRYLAQEGLEEKLRTVCDDLLGPIFSRSSGASAWQPTILGTNKREFLKRILPTIGANLRWQRLYTEYQEQLESLDT
ncbi:protein HIRA-like isoform X2 [Littorina saxatilis]|uniref:protein HIRA-like isoform X2 n=1 Tax=Littorina saxatilis TaxID=31220 RepID=UPI0038B69BED